MPRPSALAALGLLLALAAAARAQEDYFAAAAAAAAGVAPAASGPEAPTTTPKPCGEPDKLNTSGPGMRPSKEDVATWEKTTIAAVAAAKAELRDALADVDAAWRRYTAKMNAPTMADDAARRGVFAANLKAWSAENDKRSDPYLALGLSQFAHLTADEFKKYYLMDTATVRKVARFDRPLSAAAAAAANADVPPPPFGDAAGSGGARRRLMQGPLVCNKNRAWPYNASPTPTYWDWRNANVVTSVKAQLGCGSCTAFASVGALETCFIRKWWDLGYRASNTDLSEDDFMECQPDLSEDDFMECQPGDQCRGAWADTVLDRCVCNGVAFESAQPYNANDGNNCRAIPRYISGALGWSYVPADTSSLAKSVRNNPTVIALDATAWQGFAAGWVRNCGEPWSVINHSVLVVGWVDNVPMSNGENWSFWYIKNSWGAGFNNAGYIWIRKGCGGNGPFGMWRNRPWVPVCSV